MIKTILFEEKLRPHNDEKSLYYFERSFIAEMNSDDIDKNIDNLTNTINSINKKLDAAKDIDKNGAIKLKELDNDFKIKNEAYNDFDKYFSDAIIDMKKSKVKQKLELKKYLDNYEKVKVLLIEKHKEQLKNQIKGYKSELKNQQDMLDIYKDYNKNE